MRNFSWVLMVFVSIFCFADSFASTSKPNILVIMVDDMGFSDMGSFGGEIQTPNLDTLANNGLRFTQFYNMARCSPSRASALTGQYPHKVNLGRNGGSLGRNGITIAEALGGTNGYNTTMVGKWHLSALPNNPPDCSSRLQWLNHQCGLNAPFAADINTYPINRGFDQHYGVIWGVVDFFDPFSLVDGTSNVVNAPADWAATHDGQGYYITDDLTEKTVQYINHLAQQPKPFFLYLQHTAPHWPLHARPEDIAKYDGVYDAGYSAIRNARYQRQVNELGMFNTETAPLAPSQHANWDSLSASQRAMQAAKMATHAAMIDRVDQGVGDIIEALQANGILDNTLILFFSDNGCSPEEYLSPGYDRPSETRDGTPIRYTGYSAGETGSQTTFPYLGSSWANVANTPLRFWKAESYDGGVCTPLIVHWPDGITAPPGSIVSDMGHVIDVMPTCLEIAGVDYPSTYNGYNLTPLDGKSLTPLFTGQDRLDQELYFEHEGGKAARVEDWKISQVRGNNDWQLYNFASDRTETQDVKSEYPRIFQGMLNKWNNWASQLGISGADSGPYENDALYKFQDNTDDSYAFNDGVYLSGSATAPVFATGYDGQAIVFDGTVSGGVVEVANEVPSDFTIAFWVKTSDPAVGEPKFFYGKGLVTGEVPGPTDKFGLSLTDGGKVYFGMARDGMPAEHINSQATINDGTWRHVAAVHDADVGDGANGSIQLYIDGIQVDTAADPVYYGVKNDAANLLIGAIADQTGGFFGVLDGMLDELHLYSRALPSAEILALANISDSTPPTPDPAGFDIAPFALDNESISMTAQPGEDAHPPIEYFFEEVTGRLGGTDSGWQSSTEYVDSNLQPGTLYNYTVRMRDAAGNETAPSAAVDAWTKGIPDLDGDGFVDLNDIAALAQGWMFSNCLAGDLCGGRDIDLSNVVDIGDLEMVAQAWLTQIIAEPILFFSDTYDRANSYDVDAISTGMAGELAPVTYVEAFEGSGTDSSIQVNSNRLQVATGVGMSSLYLDHSFIDDAVVNAGGFRVEMDVDYINSSAGDEANRFGGFGVGNTQAEAQSAGDSFDSAAPFRPNVARANQGIGVSDFYVDLAQDSRLRVWSNGNLLHSIYVDTSSGTIGVDFLISDFTAGSAVTAVVYFNGSEQVVQAFNWDYTDSNYIGISGRAATYVWLDNLKIQTLQ